MVGQFGSWRHDISLRHAEILLVLAMFPEGRSAPALAADLYGDRTRVVTGAGRNVSAAKAIGGPVLGQPYRFPETAAVQVRYPDDMTTLLAASTAPAVQRRPRVLLTEMYCAPVEVDPDIASSGLLDGLEGEERAERAELVAWLLERASPSTRSGARSRRCCSRRGGSSAMTAPMCPRATSRNRRNRIDLVQADATRHRSAHWRGSG